MELDKKCVHVNFEGLVTRVEHQNFFRILKSPNHHSIAIQQYIKP